MKFLVVLFLTLWVCILPVCNAKTSVDYFDKDHYIDTANPDNKQKYAQEICDWYISQKSVVVNDLKETLPKNVNGLSNVDVKHNRFDWIGSKSHCEYLNYCVSFRGQIKERPCCGVASGFMNYKGTDVRWFHVCIADAESGEILYSVYDNIQEFLGKYNTFLREKYGKDE